MSDQESRWKFMSRKVIGRENNPMMIRWRLIQTPWFGLYLHFIHREDLDRLPHDHPWAFRTLILRGSYVESYFEEARLIGSGREESYSRVWPRWSHRRFPMHAAHRITDVHGKLTTLVLVGRKERTWGFWTYSGEFIDWREYEAAANGWSDEQRRQATS